MKDTTRDMIMEKLELYPVYNITAVAVSINKDGKYVITTEHYPVSSEQESEDKIEKEKIPTELHILILES